MVDEPLSEARERAEQSAPAVRAAALMHIARVLKRSNKDAAVELLDRAIRITEELESEAATLLLQNAVYLAAAVSPTRAIQLYADFRRKEDPFGSEVVALVNAMAEHGHAAAAVAYLSNPLPGDRFPVHFVNNLAAECRDEETLLNLLRLAIREWERRDPHTRGLEERFASSAFNALFGSYWRLLPTEEARSILRKLVQETVELPAKGQRLPLTDDPEDPELSSEAELLLFRLLPALQFLDANSVVGILEDRPQLAAAAKRFPSGMQSVWDAQARYDPARDDAMMIGNSEVMYLSEALATDFSAAFQEAHSRHTKDSNPDEPNQAPKECWPSAQEYRNILFKAGQHLGLSASRYLDRIPDPDLRLFAQIELCAAVEGLPQIASFTVEPSSLNSDIARV